MRFTTTSFAQHLGWTFKKHWQLNGKLITWDTGVAKELEKVGINIKTPEAVIKPHVERNAYRGDGPHPYWHEQKCHIYGNGNVLLEGMRQAQVLTKTIQVKRLPQTLEDLLGKIQLPSSIDRNVQQVILSSNVFDAEQVKLAKAKIPNRPGYNLPRDYGIAQQRKNHLLVNRLFNECEKYANRTHTSLHRILDKSEFIVTVPKDESLLQFNIRVDKMLTANKPIDHIKGTFDADLPDLYPIKSTISLSEQNVYTTETCFPLSDSINCSHPHTIITYFDKEYVKNLHGTGISADQFQSRTLLNAFAVAVARAKQLYGELCMENIPKPIVVQSIQTDGRTFHFGVFQLNTMALGENGELKNYWFHQQTMDLYAQIGYKHGRAYLEGYDRNVFRYLNAFYHNI